MSDPSSATERAKKQLWHGEKSAFCLSGDLTLQLQNMRLSQHNSKGILKDITVTLPQTLKRCNPNFIYEPNAKPKRVLTKPAEPAQNDGHDNINHDLIIHINDIFQPDPPSSGVQYRVVDLLGQGTFGQVVKCVNLTTQETVAIKVVKNKRAYYDQGVVELRIIRRLNNEFDPHDKNHIVRLKDYFRHHSHLCLVFELLSINLYELIKMNLHRGFSMNLLCIFLQQIIQAQTVLNKAHCIHCDLKPENILLCELSSPQIKVIDFGSACYENQTVFSYIQSRFYRSPEVILGVPYTAAIDVWSIGCIAAELFFGLPLFPGNSEYNQISRIVEMLGMPPDWMLQQGKNTRKYFTVGSTISGAMACNMGPTYQLKSEERYAMESRTKVVPGKKYFTHPTLTENILNFPMRADMTEEQKLQENNLRRCLAHFLSGLLQLDPIARWTPDQALKHPFITKSPHDPNWTPPQPKATTLPQAIPSRSFGANPTPEFSPRSHFHFQLGASPSTNYSPLHSSNFAPSGSSPMHTPMHSSSLPKDATYGYYPNSPMYMLPPMPNTSYTPSSSFQLGSTPTGSSFYYKPPQQATPPDTSRLAQSFTQPKNYRSQRGSQTQRNTVSHSPYSPSRSPFKTNPMANVPATAPTTTPSINSQPQSNTQQRKTHRKMPSTGQFGFSSFELPTVDIDSFQEKSNGSPAESPKSSKTSDGEWDDQFYFEDDHSPGPNEKPADMTPSVPSSGRYGNSYPQTDMSISLGSSPGYHSNSYQAFSQGGLSYNGRHETSFLDPSVFPSRKSTNKK